MLNIVDRLDWDIYKQDAPYLDIRTALFNLNSDVEVKRKQSLADLEDAIEFSFEMYNSLVFELVRVLFEMLQLDEFKYKNYAAQILALCGKYTQPQVTDPRNIKQQNQLREVICERLKKYSSLGQSDLDVNSRNYLAYLETICKNTES